jgi:Kef-type K+ transport system membrane component KefB
MRAGAYCWSAESQVARFVPIWIKSQDAVAAARMSPEHADRLPGVFVRDRVLVHRMRAIAFSILTPFYFIKAGLLVSLPAVIAGAALIGAFFVVKVATKAFGVWPASRLLGLGTRDANYTTLLMSTGLTFGSISALFGLTNGFIDQAQYAVLVTTVILSAVVPTILATTFFEPHVRGVAEQDEVEAAEEIDAGPLRHPRLEVPGE